MICKELLAIVTLTTFIVSCTQKQDYKSTPIPPFGKGKLVTNNNFTGSVWVNYLTETDSIHNVNIGSVTFAPGSRTNWHYHEGGQILLITAGRGLYQEKGKPIEIMEMGDVVKCPPNIEHWHGATPTDTMTHIAIGTNTNIGGAIWGQHVSDKEYLNH